MSGPLPSDSDAASFPEIGTDRPQSARIYNYWLGGKDYFPVDREMGERAHRRAVLPGIPEMARCQRAFLARVVTFLAREVGIRQFLDIGTGLPTANNTHEVAQAVAPESRIVYVDNDPIVLVHARALLTSAGEGKTAYIDADLRDPDKILEAAAQTLDFTQPIAVMLLGIVHHITDTDEAHTVVNRLLEAVPSGSNGTKPARYPSSSAPRSSSLASSIVWSCWILASCLRRGGGPTPPTPAASTTWTSSARSGASPNP